jgi:hypothetical protein
MSITAAFEQELRRLVSEVFGPLADKDGCALGDIEAAEVRLKLSLPEVLRSCYRLVGSHRAFNEGMQNLRPLQRLRISEFEADGGFEYAGLIFLLERQQAYFSVVRRDALSQDDPPVFQGNINEKKLYPECPRLSSHLLQALCWNAMQVMPSGGSAEDESIDLTRFESRMRIVESGPRDPSQLRAFQRGHLVVCAFPKPGSDHYDVYVAAQTDDELERFEHEFGLQLSWN